MWAYCIKNVCVKFQGPLQQLLIWAIILAKWGFYQSAQNRPIKISQQFFYTKFKFKGGQFLEKIANSCIWGNFLLYGGSANWLQ